MIDLPMKFRSKFWDSEFIFKILFIYKNIKIMQKVQVAIIGLGNLGKTLASNLVAGQRQIIIADTTLDKAIDLSNQLGSLSVPTNVNDAILQAEILILAIHFDSIKEFLSEHSKELEGKFIIDPSNPIEVDGEGRFTKVIAEKESSGQILSTLLPQGAKLSKALGTLSISSLYNSAHKNPAFVQFYANDHQSFDSVIEDLIRDNGFVPMNIGGIDQSIRIEVFGDLNEYGAIGKPVSFSEAKLIV